MTPTTPGDEPMSKSRAKRLAIQRGPRDECERAFLADPSNRWRCVPTNNLAHAQYMADIALYRAGWAARGPLLRKLLLFVRDLHSDFCDECRDDCYQNIAEKHSIVRLQPAREQVERDEWGDDAELYYLEDDIAAALAKLEED